MRALLLFAVVLFAFLAVRWFRGDPGTAQAGAAQAPLVAGSAAEPQTTNVSPEGPARFLAPPSRPAASENPSPAATREASAPPATAAPDATAWPASLLPTGGGPTEDVAVAAALVHGTPAEVQAAAAGLPRDRALLLESFAWAVAGEKQEALSLSEKISSKDGLESRERAFFEAALTGRAAAQASTASGPVPLAMEMALLARDARRALDAKDFVAAAEGYSDLLKGELGAPWAPDRRVLAGWTDGLRVAQREYRWNPRATWPGIEVKVQPGESLIGIRKRYLADRPDARMCTGLVERANRVKGYLQPGQTLRIPTDAVRVLVDLDARWALFLMGEEVAAAWPVGIGRPGEDTPPGDYTVRNKLENPPWMKEGQEPIPFGDPRNPLGTRWMGWSKDGAKTSYGFHGTWDPDSIGQAQSDGCVRFLNADVEELFQILPEGAPIRIEG